MSEEKTGIDWPLERKAFRRVWRDLRWPALVALLISLYKSKFTLGSLFEDVSFFFTTWFFSAAYFSYYQRSKKLVIDERNHTAVVGKQDAVIIRLETLADELEGHISGGNGFCYVSNVRTDEAGVVELKIEVDSKYPLLGVQLELSDTFFVSSRFKKWQETGSIRHILVRDITHSIDTAFPKTAYHVGCDLRFKSPIRMNLMLNWQAKNGRWTQSLQLEKIGSTWLMATSVNREDVLLYSKIDSGFPVDESGNPVCGLYGEDLPKWDF